MTNIFVRFGVVLRSVGPQFQNCGISNLMAVAPSRPLTTRELIYTLSPTSVKLGFEFCEELTLRWR